MHQKTWYIAIFSVVQKRPCVVVISQHDFSKQNNRMSFQVSANNSMEFFYKSQHTDPNASTQEEGVPDMI